MVVHGLDGSRSEGGLRCLSLGDPARRHDPMAWGDGNSGKRIAETRRAWRNWLEVWDIACERLSFCAGAGRTRTHTLLSIVDSACAFRRRARKGLRGGLARGECLAVIGIVSDRDCLRVDILVVEEGAASLTSCSFGKRLGKL